MDDSNHIRGAVGRMTGCVLVLILMSILGVLQFPGGHKNKAANFAVTKVELQNIAFALNKYFTASNAILAGDSAALFSILMGSNGTGMRLLTPRKTNWSGEMLDIWNTPYQIEIVYQTNTLIRSAGPNRQFGDKDDVYIRTQPATIPTR